MIEESQKGETLGRIRRVGQYFYVAEMQLSKYLDKYWDNGDICLFKIVGVKPGREPFEPNSCDQGDDMPII